MRKELTGTQRLLGRIEGGEVVIRGKRERFSVEGECVAVGGCAGIVGRDGFVYVLLRIPVNAPVHESRSKLEPLSKAEVEEAREAMKDLVPEPSCTEKPS